MEDSEQLSSRLEQLIKENGGSINAFAAKAGIDQSSLNKIIKGRLGMSNKIVDAISSTYHISPAWLRYGEGDKEEAVKMEYKPNFLSYGQMGTLSTEQGSDYEMLPVIPKFPNYDYTIEVRGDSMLPDYKSGDLVACLDVTKSSFVQWGREFILNTSQGIVLKTVFDDGDNVKCVSKNSAFPDLTIPKDDIYSIGLVVGLLRIS